MELTLGVIISNLLVSLLNYFLLNHFHKDIEKIISGVQFSFQSDPKKFSPNWEPEIASQASSSTEVCGTNTSEVNLVMSRLGMGDNWDYNRGLNGKDLEELFDEEEPSLEEIREAFEVFDLNRDGLIDAGDLQRVFLLLGFREGSDLRKCERMIQAFDCNGDGVIDFHEFVKFMEKCLC